MPCPWHKELKENKDQIHKYCEPCLVTNFKMQFAENRLWECGMRTSSNALCNLKLTNLDGFNMSEESQGEIDTLLAKVYYAEQTDVQFCPNPNCEAPCKLSNPADTVVVCQVSDCNTSFCFYCTTIQKGKTCTNQDCNQSGIASILAASPKITISSGVTGPQTRMCPKCGNLMEHVSGCKHSTCRMCNYKFCHVCLATEDKWNVAPCLSGWVMCQVIAPPQTVTGISKRDLKYNDL